MTLNQLEVVVRDRLGVDPGSLGGGVLSRAIDTRRQATRTTTLEAYLALLITHAEADALAAELAVPETWFFRGGRRLYDALADFLIRRAARTPGRPARALSLPCSTGEEPYSLAIALHEQLLPHDQFRIDAIDVSATHLDRAVAGLFSEPSFREHGTDPRLVHFRPVGVRWELLPHLRPLVQFRQGNATDPNFLAGEGEYDLIFCRNLFIYLTADGRKRAMAHLDRLLAADGRLCLSAAEADRLPVGGFVADGPAEFCVFRRAVGGVPATSSTISTGLPPLPPAAVPGTLPPIPQLTADAANTPPPDRPTFDTARTLADAGRLAEARVACERAIAAQPAAADGYALLGAIHHAQGNTIDAGEAFRKALYLDPDHTEAISHLAVLADRRGDTIQASALRRRLTRLTLRGGNA
ncbi:MAG: hypothetical protein MUF18_00840 [Fimbriiglobus sp.]|jgi:chemotaxis protein methyltransferase WspC|nr:hypothetical protein [Fimbriiglobus sp.]